MLDYSRMYSRGFRNTALMGLTFLVASPNGFVFAATLREEAVSYRTQGYEAQQRGDLAQAMSYYQKAEALDPAYPTPHNDAGVLLETQNRFEEAERSYQQAITLQPNYLEAHANLAILYERMGQQEKAIGHWMKRYELGDPSDPWTGRAEERLRALGVLKKSWRLGGKFVSHRRIFGQEFKAHEQSLEDFHAVTEKHRNWQ